MTSIYDSMITLTCIHVLMLLSQEIEGRADTMESDTVDTLDTYVYLLKIHQAIAPCDNSLKNCDARRFQLS